MTIHSNNVKVYKDIENGLKKYVSPCNGINNNTCICNECNIVWFCDDCSENVVCLIDLNAEYDIFGITLKKIKEYYKEQKSNNKMF